MNKMNITQVKAIQNLPTDWWKTKAICISFENILKGFILGLMLSGEFAGIKQSYLFSGFLFKYCNSIIWFTAGHVINNINKVISSTPIDNYVGRWIDWENIRGAESIPVNFKAFTAFSGWDFDFDFGMYILSTLETENIAKNTHSVCFNMGHVIDLETFQPEGYYLFGFPEKLREETRVGTTTFNTSPLICVPLEKIPFTKDLQFTNSDPNAFYGKIVDFPDSPETKYEIPGMSGGPIIGIKRDKTKGIDFRLYAIQSSCLPESRIIQAEPMTIPIKLLEENNN